jgi:phosphatidate cytidylyltransferase
VSLELKKRIITSIFLITLVILMLFYTYVLILSLIVIGIISWIEFYALISKIFKKKNYKDISSRFLCKTISLLYLSLLIYLIIYIKLSKPEMYVILIYAISISIMTDIGGLVIGKIFKGKKLTKISPQKTISGSLGSFIFSIALIPIFIQYLPDYSILNISLITLLISLTSQIGDIFISYLKRKAKVKNTSDLLPGHGGVLDRIDGIIFTIPVIFLIFNIF